MWNTAGAASVVVPLPEAASMRKRLLSNGYVITGTHPVRSEILQQGG